MGDIYKDFKAHMCVHMKRHHFKLWCYEWSSAGPSEKYNFSLECISFSVGNGERLDLPDNTQKTTRGQGDGESSR